MTKEKVGVDLGDYAEGYAGWVREDGRVGR